MNKAVRILVKGSVQGVGYRFFARDLAFRDKLKGYVKNLSSGDVEVVLEGEDSSVDRVLTELKKGPSGSNVTSFEVKDLNESGERFSSFKIRF